MSSKRVQKEQLHTAAQAMPLEPHEAANTRSTEESVSRSAAMMSVLVIVSRLTGFLRTWGQAYALGVTLTASCYSVANNLPNQLYELVIGGMLVTAFLPVYLSVKKEKGAQGASDYSSNLVSIVLILMGAVCVLGFVFAQQVVFTQSFNAGADFDMALTVYFFRFFVIEVVLYSLSSIFSGILNAERDYFWSSAAPIFNNFVTTASFLAYAFLLESQPKLALILLALGNPLGVAVQVLMQMPSLKKHGVRLRPYLNLHDPALKDTLSIGIPSLVVMACSFVTVSVMTSSALAATNLGASVSYYARLWYTLPYAILAVPITTALFTELSDFMAKGQQAEFTRAVGTGIGRIVFLMLPFMLYLVVFATPLITLLGAGSFTAEGIELTAGYLQVLALSLPFYAVCMYLQKVCSSMRRMGLFAVANVVAAAVQVAMCLIGDRLHLPLSNVALSSMLFFVSVDVVTLVSLRRELAGLSVRQLLASSARGLVFGVAGAAVGALVLYVLGPATASARPVLAALLRIVAGGIPAVLVSFGLALVLHAPEAQIISHLIKGKTHSAS